jgi:flagellar basal-body rod modification protein FlgD
MTTASPLTSVTSSSSASASGASPAAAATSASATYNTFLTLLTTQLQNQDPLNPTNTDTFTSEMIQLSGVEQELAINNTLSTISTNLSSITASSGLGYIGKQVSAGGDTSPMQNGTAQWSYSLGSAAANVKLTVADASGNTVYSTSGDNGPGTHSFSWNGTNSSGGVSTSGDYTLSVTATDATGAPVTTSTDLVGTVTGVDTSSGSTLLQLGDINVPLANVTTLTN